MHFYRGKRYLNEPTMEDYAAYTTNHVHLHESQVCYIFRTTGIPQTKDE